MNPLKANEMPHQEPLVRNKNFLEVATGYGAQTAMAVLIREAQPVAADEQHFGVCHPQRFQCFPHTAAACRNRAIPPPVVKRRTVGDLVSHRDADRQMLRCVDTANFLYKAGHIVQLELCHGVIRLSGSFS